LWVTGYASRRNGRDSPAHLQEFDAATGELLGDLTLPDDGPFEIRVAGGAVWVAAQQAEQSTELLKIDAASMRIVARLPGSVSSTFAASADAIWSPDGVGALRRIDPTTAQVVASIPVHKFAIYAATGVAAGRLGVFAVNGYDGTVQRVDEATNTAGPGIDAGLSAGEVVELGNALWISRGTGSQLVELVHGTSVGRTIELGERGLSLATDGRSLWIGTASAHVLRVDPESASVTRVALPAGTRATTVAADPGSGGVWATSMVPSPRILRVPTTP
jgi:DNA-binding beta-propeller fold protein YncE